MRFKEESLHFTGNWSWIMRSSRKESFAQNANSIYAEGNGALRNEDVSKKWKVWVYSEGKKTDTESF